MLCTGICPWSTRKRPLYKKSLTEQRSLPHNYRLLALVFVCVKYVAVVKAAVLHIHPSMDHKTIYSLQRVWWWVYTRILQNLFKNQWISVIYIYITVFSKMQPTICYLLLWRKDELAVTRRNYEDQLSLMSEHLAAMNDKLASQKDQIESLKLTVRTDIRQIIASETLKANCGISFVHRSLKNWRFPDCIYLECQKQQIMFEDEESPNESGITCYNGTGHAAVRMLVSFPFHRAVLFLPWDEMCFFLLSQ